MKVKIKDNSGITEYRNVKEIWFYESIHDEGIWEINAWLEFNRESGLLFDVKDIVSISDD